MLNFNDKWLLFYCLFECRRVLFSTSYAPKRVSHLHDNPLNILACQNTAQLLKIYQMEATVYIFSWPIPNKTSYWGKRERKDHLYTNIWIFIISLLANSCLQFPFWLKKVSFIYYRKYFGERRAFDWERGSIFMPAWWHWPKPQFKQCRSALDAIHQNHLPLRAAFSWVSKPIGNRLQHSANLKP